MTAKPKRKAPAKAPPMGDEPPTVPSGRGVVLPPDSKPKRTATTEARIEEAASYMRGGSFIRGKTVKMLAERWGVTVDTAKDYTAEASRRVRAEYDAFAKDDAPAWLLSRIERVVEDSLAAAEKMKGSRVAADHRRVALQALDHVRQLTGAGAPTRIDVTTEGLRLPDDPAERAKIYEALAERERSRAGGG